MNWIAQNKPNKVSSLDKLRELLKIHYKLVLIQADELARLRVKQKGIQTDYEKRFIDFLYNHYIVQGLGKTEMYTAKI
jgi:hypothetical protein